MYRFDRTSLLQSATTPLLAALLCASVGAAVLPSQEASPGVSLMTDTLAGRVVPAEDIAMLMLSMAPKDRVALIAALDDASHRSRAARMSLTAQQKSSLEQLTQQLGEIPGRYVGELDASNGLHPNAKPMLAAGIDLTAELGRAGHVDNAFLLAGPWPRTDKPRFQARPKELTRALSGILQNDRTAYDDILGHFRTASPTFARAIIDTFAKDDHPRAVDALARCLRKHPGLDGIILNRIQGVASKNRSGLHATELHSIRRYLSSPSEFEREQAAKCCGSLDDIDAASSLIDRLSDDSQKVVRAAHASLQGLTAMSMGPERRRWRNWLQEQETVWETRRSEFLSIVSQPRDPRFVKALNQIALLRLHRAEIAPALAELLKNTTDAEPLRLGCAAVESLRAEGALGQVVPLLDHEEESVAQRAHRTLVVVTGRDLPATSSRWQRIVSQR